MLEKDVLDKRKDIELRKYFNVETMPLEEIAKVIEEAQDKGNCREINKVSKRKKVKKLQ